MFQDKLIWQQKDKNSLKKAQVFIEMGSHIFLIWNLKILNILTLNVMK